MTDEGVLLARLPVAPTTRIRHGAGSDAFFRLQLETHLDAAYRLAMVILGDRGDADDATHDAVESAWRNRRALRDPERFEPWLQRIVVNACRDRIRRRKATPVQVSVDLHEGRLPLLGRGATDPAESIPERDAMAQALARLSADQRVVVAMRFYLDLQVDEIARRLGTRSGTVKSRLHRALAQLRDQWEANS